MRIVSLLPAATEIVAALGAADHLVAISHECDYPPELSHLPRVTGTPIDPALPGAAIDAEVRRLQEAGRAVIALEAGTLERLAPDLIITQSLCDVCAVADGEVQREVVTLASIFASPPRVLVLHGRTLAGIGDDIRAVGAAVDRVERAEVLVAEMSQAMAKVRAGAGSARPRVVCIEWLDPLYLAGHWVPELVAAAGGDDVGARPGDHSRRATWAEIDALHPEHLLIMLCGFGIERARGELEALTDGAARSLLERVPVSLIDGNAYTSRAGPRVTEGASQIRRALAHAGAPSALSDYPAPVRSV